MLERQESGRSLREALEKAPLVELWHTKGFRVMALPETTVRELLAAHPAEPAPEVIVDHRPGETCSVVADIDPETGFSRPLLDREAVENAIATKVMYYDSGTAVHAVDDSDLAGLVAGVEAVMEMARPMPTREQIAEALRKARDSDGKFLLGGSLVYDGVPTELAEAVLALLNGTGGVSTPTT